MRTVHKQIHCQTNGPGLYEITGPVSQFVDDLAMSEGLLTVFCRHTSASLLIQENADPDVRDDLTAFFQRLVPDGDPLFKHTCEGPDDMPAHVKSALTTTSLSIPLIDSAMALGTWQGIYLFEHRHAAHTRRILITAVGT